MSSKDSNNKSDQEEQSDGRGKSQADTMAVTGDNNSNNDTINQIDQQIY